MVPTAHGAATPAWWQFRYLLAYSYSETGKESELVILLITNSTSCLRFRHVIDFCSFDQVFLSPVSILGEIPRGGHPEQ